MSTATTFDLYMDRINRGDRLSPAEIRELADTPDILSLGMLADTVRRKMHGTRATFVRVADVAFDAVDASVPPAAREVRLTGTPADLDSAVTAVETARSVAGDRTVVAFSWTDVARWSAGSSVDRVLTRLAPGRSGRDCRRASRHDRRSDCCHEDPEERGIPTGASGYQQGAR